MSQSRRVTFATWLLKDLAPLIAPTICCLCNLSMDSGVVPAQLG